MAKYKYKLNEMSKTASAEDAEKVLTKPKSGFEVGQVEVSDDGNTKTTITNINPQTGAIQWKVEQLPGFDSLYAELDDLVDVAKNVYVKTKADKKFRDFYDQVRKLRNSVRTHLRNEYPDQYKRIVRLGEAIKIPDPTSFADMDDEEKEQISKITGPLRDLIKQFKLKKEVSMSGAAGSYLTPYAFSRKTAKKADDEDNKEIGYTLVKENEIGNKINIARAKSHFKQGEKIAAINKKTQKLTKITGANQFSSFNPKEYDFAYLNEEGSSWGLEPRQLADSFTFDELEQLYNDKKISKEDLNGAKSYLQSWIDQHPTYLPQRDLTSSNRQKIRDKYLNEGTFNTDNHVATFGGDDGYAEVYKQADGSFYIVVGGDIDYDMTATDSKDVAAKLKRDGYTRLQAGGLNEVVDLVHVKEPDGSLYGTGEVVKIEKDKTWVKFDGNTIKKFDSDKVVPIQEDAQKSANIHKQGKDPGATLGPGPSAGPDGVTDNAYVKQFKFKLVPKNKDGTYVQKGSTLPVRKLWG